MRIVSIEERLADAPDELEAQMLRIERLVATGRFETALTLSRRLCDLAPGQDSAELLVSMLEQWLSDLPVSGAAVNAWSPQSPFDFALYLVLLWRLRPGVDVEIGGEPGEGRVRLDGDTGGGAGASDTIRIQGAEHPRVTVDRGVGTRLAGSGAAAAWAQGHTVSADTERFAETCIAVLRLLDEYVGERDRVVVEDRNSSDSHPELTGEPSVALRPAVKVEAEAAWASRQPDTLATERPWRQTEPSSEILAVPSMLSSQERGLLYWLGSEYWTGTGAVIDAGCFLGGSTMALATGIRDGGREAVAPPITVYDQFQVEDYALAGGFFDDAPELGVGDDFSALFRRNVEKVGGLLDVRAGNILEQRWGRAPIEILFLDVLKSWQINDYVVREFWPAMLPGAIVVQQDYQYGGYPWLAITMELLHEYFERLDEMPWGTVMFRLRAPLPDLRTMTLSRDLPMIDKLELMDRALTRETQPSGQAMLRLSRALLLGYLGRWRIAHREMNAVARQHRDDISVVAAANFVLSRTAESIWGEGIHHDPCARALRSLALPTLRP